MNAADIVRELHPRRVLCADGELACALVELGVEVVEGGAADLVISTGALGAADAGRAVAVLLLTEQAPVTTLRLLASLGFAPQPDYAGEGVLFGRGGADMAALVEALESQRNALQRIEGRAALNQKRLDEILHSRIWRTLCACGGVLLKILGGAKAPRGLKPALQFEEFERRDDAWMRLKERTFKRRPLISVVTPVFRPAPADLERAIASVRAQSYENWELLLADDATGAEEVAAVLARAAQSDTRIRVTALPAHGGISAASNAALGQATGEYIALLDQDDELSEDALFHVIDAINRDPEAGFLYSDEDKLDAAGTRYDPFFKPDWSPDLLLSEDYCGHLLVARRDLVEQAGGFRSEYDGAQDYDLILRLSALTQKVAHIPRVLYHWRAAPGSAAAEAEAKPYAIEAGGRAIEDHLQRSGSGGTVTAGCGPGRWRVHYPVPAGSRVTILIPSGGNVAALRACLDSLAARTAYTDYEVLVIDNSHGSRIERLVRGRGIRCLDWRGRPFNYSAMNNAAAGKCLTPLLLFLNDDVEALDAGWLEAMVELGVRPEAGAIGARLLYPDGRIQHAGVALDILESGGHVFRGLGGSAHHYFDFPDVIRNVSAVTGACMLVRAAAFDQAGGFDETRFPVSFNDVDLCLRLARLGLRNLYTPYAVLQHREALSRARRNLVYDPAGLAALRARWKDLLDRDPYYSPNLTRTSEDCSPRYRGA